MTRPRPKLAAAPLLVALLLIGCGGKEDDGNATQGQRAAPVPNERTSMDARSDQGGAQVASGAGSALLGAPAEAGLTTAGATRIRPFGEASPWNTVVAGAPVDGRSARWIELVRIRADVRERGSATPRVERAVVDEGIYVNTRTFTTPIVSEVNGVPTRVTCRQLPDRCGDGATVDTLQIPPDVSPLPRYDGWFTVLDRPNGVAYDLWRARRGGGDGTTMSYQFMRKWDLDGPGFLEPSTASARGSGLPLFAGVLLPEEIRSGRIDHALAISLPGPARRRYVQPASSTDGNGDEQSMPEGARIRLKRDVELDLEQLSPRTNQRAARAIYEALRRYGAIVVGRARVPALYAKYNADWGEPLRGRDGELLRADGTRLSRSVRSLPNQGTPLLRGSEVEQLKIEDFEVVQNRGPVLTYPPPSDTQGAGSTGFAGEGSTAATEATP